MNQVESLEEQLKTEKLRVERRDAILRLSKNPDFRKLIIEDFCRNECARYVHESGDPSLTAEQRADALNIAQAAGHLKRFLNVNITMGDVAERTVMDLDQAIEEARASEGQEEID
jgi:hypothetical protein